MHDVTEAADADHGHAAVDLARSTALAEPTAETLEAFGRAILDQWASYQATEAGIGAPAASQ